MYRVLRHFPHDEYLCVKQRSGGVVIRDGGPVVCKDYAGLNIVVRRYTVAKRLRGEAEPVRYRCYHQIEDGGDGYFG